MNRLSYKYLIYAYLLLILVPEIVGAQNIKADGYKGIWFTLGQFSEYGDKYSGGLGTYTANHNPVAIYAPEVNKTFFVYGGTRQQHEKHLLIMLSYYDHNKGIVPKPVVVHDKAGVDDPHDNASVAIDAQGYIWVFVSGRNVTRLGFIFKSRRPYEIDAFDEMYKGDMTYPQPWWVPGKGFVHLFTRYTKGRELYWNTSADGRTWAPGQKLASMGGHYQLSGMQGNKLVSVFNYLPGNNADKRTNLYLLQTENLGNTWTTVDGKPVSTPLTAVQNAALVHPYEAEGKLVYLNDLNFDKNGNPVILAVISNHHQPGPKGNPHEWQLIHWEYGKWNIRKVLESTHNYDMGSLYINNDYWEIIGPTEPGPQLYGTGGEMALWVSKNNGKDWKKKRNLTNNSSRNHSYARRPLAAHPDFYAFWADGNADKFSESKLYFSNKNGKKVWELPYNMTKDFEKPRRIK
ncbi:BNR-4 repeat-containing protein [Pontibacter sp. 13R65]|uniref:BNR-4 repeat-containing protein n=1 Tax=Pontibacter sp. 13R65 TaxID=3127458 RepID=UPI00301D1C3C